MWRNYWTVAVRALAKSKTYSIINIVGLAIGMAACIMILLYIRYEQSYDEWIPDAENSYQFQAWYPNPQDGEPGFFQMSSYVTKDRIKKDFPQVQHAAYFQNVGPVFFKDGQQKDTIVGVQVTPSIGSSRIAMRGSRSSSEPTEASRSPVSSPSACMNASGSGESS